MSIYNDERVTLPQVKILHRERARLYGFLKIFHRQYSDFIRDLCDANIKWHAQDISKSFEDHAAAVAHLITKRYMEKDYKFFSTKSGKDARESLNERLNIHSEPYPHIIVRLPSVAVSKWQADNLHEFLAKYARNYADFIRVVCENIQIDTFESQCENVEFTESVDRIFTKAFDELIGAKNMVDAQYVKRQWPTGYWQQRQAIKNRNRNLGR